MPCSDGGWANDCSTERKKLDLYAQMLCALCTYVEVVDGRICSFESAMDTHEELREWWRKHKIQDEAERAREEKVRLDKIAKENALRKLTKSEKKLLGLS